MEEAKIKIMLVDDSRENLDVLTFLFEDEGFEVFPLNNPHTIDEAISNFCPEVMLLDVMMPGENGVDICQRIKLSPKSSHIKIILMTASNAFSTSKITESIADSFIAKPFDIDEISALVKNLLEK